MATERPDRGRGWPLLRELRPVEKRIRRGEPPDRVQIRTWLMAAKEARAANDAEAPALAALVRIILRRRVLAVLAHVEDVFRRGQPLVEPMLTRPAVFELRSDLDAAAELGGRVGKIRVRLAALLTAQLASRLSILEQMLREPQSREVGSPFGLVASLWDELLDAEALDAPNLEPLALRLATAQAKLDQQRRASAGLPGRSLGRAVIAARVGSLHAQFAGRPGWREFVGELGKLAPELGRRKHPRALAGLRRIGIGNRMQASPGLAALLSFVQRMGGRPEAFLNSLHIRGRRTGTYALPEMPLIQKTVVQLDWVEGEPDPWEHPSTIARAQTMAEALAEQGVQVELVRGRPVPAERYARDEARSAADFTVHGPQGPVVLDRLAILDGAVSVTQRPGFIEVIVAPTRPGASATPDATAAPPLPLVRTFLASASPTTPAAADGQEQHVETLSSPSAVGPHARRERRTAGPSYAADASPAAATWSPPARPSSTPDERIGEGTATPELPPTLSTQRPMVSPVVLDPVAERRFLLQPQRPAERIRVEIDWVVGQDPWEQRATLEHAQEVARTLASRGVQLELVRGREVPIERYLVDQAREGRDYILPSSRGPISLADLELLDRAIPVEQRPGFLHVLVAPRQQATGEATRTTGPIGSLAQALEASFTERARPKMIFASRLLPPAHEPDVWIPSEPWWPGAAPTSVAAPARTGAPSVRPGRADDVSGQVVVAPAVNLIAASFVPPTLRSSIATRVMGGSDTPTAMPAPIGLAPAATSSILAGAESVTARESTLPRRAGSSLFTWLRGDTSSERGDTPMVVRRRVASPAEVALPVQEAATAWPAPRAAGPTDVLGQASISMPLVGHRVASGPFAAPASDLYARGALAGLAGDVIARMTSESAPSTVAASPMGQAMERALPTPSIPMLVRRDELGAAPATSAEILVGGAAPTVASTPLGWQGTVGPLDMPLLARRTDRLASVATDVQPPGLPTFEGGVPSRQAIEPAWATAPTITSHEAHLPTWARAAVGMPERAQADLWTSFTMGEPTTTATTIAGWSPRTGSTRFRFFRSAVSDGFGTTPSWTIGAEALRRASQSAMVDTATREEIERHAFAPAEASPSSWHQASTLPLFHAGSGRRSESRVPWEPASDAVERWPREHPWLDEWISEIARTTSQSVLAAHDWLSSVVSAGLPTWMDQGAATDGGAPTVRPLPNHGRANPLGLIARWALGDTAAADAGTEPAARSLAEAWFASMRAASTSPHDAPLPPASAAALPTHFGQRRLVMAARSAAGDATPFGPVAATDGASLSTDQLVPRWAIASEESSPLDEPMQTVSAVRMQEIARAAINRALSSGASQTVANSTSNVVTSSTDEQATPKQPNLDTLARQVYGIIKRRLAVEQERFGGSRAVRLW